MPPRRSRCHPARGLGRRFLAELLGELPGLLGVPPGATEHLLVAHLVAASVGLRPLFMLVEVDELWVSWKGGGRDETLSGDQGKGG